MRRLAVVMAVGLLAIPALADWDPGDPYKMHYPQMPNPFGWDLAATATGQAPNQVVRTVADDWMCSESGPVTSIHFWGSWKNGMVGNIDHFEIGIWKDDPVGPGGYFPNNPYSTPTYKWWDDGGQDWMNGEVWSWGVYPGEYTARLYATGDQGWYDPHTGQYVQHDHQEIWQYNVALPNPFVQEQGTIYWLSISAVTSDGTQWGWKTSLDHWNDDATYYDSTIPVPAGYPHAGWPMPNWLELRDPLTTESLDMAFVIVPEPTTAVLLGLAALGLLRRR